MEKILEPGEQLPKIWPVAGTTGYDAMREVNGVLLDSDREAELTALYVRLTGDERTIAEHVEQGKRMVVQTLLPAEVRRMAALVPEVPDAGAGPRRARGRLSGVPLLPAATASEQLDEAVATAPSAAGRELADTFDGAGPPAARPGSTSSPGGCSSSAAPPWPRASRTPRTTATPGSSR